MWDLIHNRCLWVLRGHKGAVTAACALPDGSLATASADRSVRIWDLETGSCVRRLLGPSTSLTALWVTEKGGGLVALTAPTTPDSPAVTGWAWQLKGAFKGGALDERALSTMPGSPLEVRKRADGLAAGKTVSACCELPGKSIAVATVDGEVAVFDAKGQRLQHTRVRHRPNALCPLSPDVLLIKDDENIVLAWYPATNRTREVFSWALERREKYHVTHSIQFGMKATSEGLLVMWGRHLGERPEYRPPWDPYSDKREFELTFTVYLRTDGKDW